MSNSIEVGWEKEVWEEIDGAVVKAVMQGKTAQKVFHTNTYSDNPLEVTNDVISLPDLRIVEGLKKPYVEIDHLFQLTSTQVAREPEEKTCMKLACKAAVAIGLAEDTVIFQGTDGVFSGNVEAEGIQSAGQGLLGEADPRDGQGLSLTDDNDLNKVSEPIEIKLQKHGNPGVLYGENTFSAVAEGIAKLTAKGQAPEFALFLPVAAYADTFRPPGNASLVYPAERIEPLVKGGFMNTVTLPPDKGLLVALAGEPITLHLGREATTEPVSQERSRYNFRVVERIQFVVRDPRALLLLRFEQPSTAPIPATAA